MANKEIKCISCKESITNKPGSVNFKCPKCGKADIVRCKHCREIVAKYVCPSCQFEGPN